LPEVLPGIRSHGLLVSRGEGWEGRVVLYTPTPRPLIGRYRPLGLGAITIMTLATIYKLILRIEHSSHLFDVANVFTPNQFTLNFPLVPIMSPVRALRTWLQMSVG